MDKENEGDKEYCVPEQSPRTFPEEITVTFNPRKLVTGEFHDQVNAK
jgi:hypothetical protein